MEKILIKKITEVIENMRVNEQASLFSEYCESCNLYDDRPERIEDIDEMFYGCKPLEILEKLEGIDLSWEYFNFDGMGIIQKWDEIEDIDEVVQEIIDSNNSFYNDEIKEILDTFSDLEELVNNAMEEIYNFENPISKNDIFEKVVTEIEKETNSKDENLFYDYENEIMEYINNFINENSEV